MSSQIKLLILVVLVVGIAVVIWSKQQIDPTESIRESELSSGSQVEALPAPVITESDAPPPVLESNDLSESRGVVAGGESLSMEIVTTAPEATASERSVDDILNGMELGSIAFNAPNEINIADKTKVQLLLSLQESVEALERQITEQGTIVSDTVKVDDRMEAALVGPEFEITAITPAIQIISGSEHTRWLWEVSPRSTGSHSLHLTLTAIFQVNGQDTPWGVKTFSHEIVVEVTIGQRIKDFISENWKWLWTAIFVPIFGYFWNRKKSKKQAHKKSE